MAPAGTFFLVPRSLDSLPTASVFCSSGWEDWASCMTAPATLRGAGMLMAGGANASMFPSAQT